MDRVDGMSCKLCLKGLTDKNFQVIEAIQKALAFLPLKLTLDESGENYMCDDCSERVFAAFDFKVMCLGIEDNLVSYVESENASQVDLRDVYSKIKQATVTSDQQVCRLCMSIVNGEFKSLEEFCDANIVQRYIPEVNFSITKDPVVCIKCWHSLGVHFDWLRKWVKLERKIKIEAQDSDDYSCIKNEEIDLTLKEDDTDGKEVAKTETDKISKILSQLRLNLQFPPYLAQLLIYNGYDTIQSLALFNDNDLKTIETFGREILPDLLSKGEMIEFYGIFIRKPSLFTVVGGHKKLLNILIDACKRHCSKERAKSLLQKRLSSQEKKVSHNIDISSEGESLQKRPSSSQESDNIRKRKGDVLPEAESLQNGSTSLESQNTSEKRDVSQNMDSFSEGESLRNSPTSSQESHVILKKKRVSQNIETLSGGESDADTTTDETAAISHIKNIILNYLTKFLDTLQLCNSTIATKKAKALQNLQEIKIKIDTKYVIVTCTECGFKSRCCGQLDNGKKKWVLSNFNKHFKTHFKNIPKETNQYIVDSKKSAIENLQNDSCHIIRQTAPDVEITESLNQTSNNTSSTNINSDACDEYLPSNLSDFLVGRTVVQNLGISSSHCFMSSESTSHEC